VVPGHPSSQTRHRVFELALHVALSLTGNRWEAVREMGSTGCQSHTLARSGASRPTAPSCGAHATVRRRSDAAPARARIGRRGWRGRGGAGESRESSEGSRLRRALLGQVGRGKRFSLARARPIGHRLAFPVNQISGNVHVFRAGGLAR
jgi:hypothetical protein